MIFMTGDTRAAKMLAILKEQGWGRMCVRDKPDPYEGEYWGFDNGAYTWWSKGQPFDTELFLKRLGIAYEVGIPYLSVTPDIVRGGVESLEYSMSWIDRLPSDWPWYLAIQDGMSVKDVEPVINRYSGLFMGGSDKFRAYAYIWCGLAHKHGKRFHVGRAGTIRKLDFAIAIGADSADSTAPLWEYRKMDDIIKHLRGPKQSQLWSEKEMVNTLNQ